MTSAAPQFSPDGQWWWDGTQWVPAAQAPTPPPQAYPPAQYGQAPPGYGYGYQPYAPTPTDGKAIASLVLSLAWMCGPGSIAAVVLGHLSRSEAKKQNRPPSGLALAGLILGYAGIAGAALLLGLLAWGSTGDVEVVRATPFSVSPEEQASQLRQLALAEEAYRGAHERYTQDVYALADYGWSDVDAAVVVSADATSYCLGSFLGPVTLYLGSETDTVSPTPCA